MSILYDLNHTLGFDLSLDATGDLQAVSHLERSQQRILRRLLSNPGDYLFHLDYGAGLPKQVGERLEINKTQAFIQHQLSQEASIAPQPAPEVKVTPIREGVSVQLHYWEAQTKQPITLSFDVNH